MLLIVALLFTVIAFLPTTWYTLIVTKGEINVVLFKIRSLTMREQDDFTDFYQFLHLLGLFILINWDPVHITCQITRT